MRHVGKPHPLADLPNAKRGVLQQLLGLGDPHAVEQLGKTLAGILADQLGKVPLAHVHALGHIGEGKLFGVVLLDVLQGIFDDKVLGALALRGGGFRALPGRRLRRFGRRFFQPAHHLCQGFFQVVQLAGLYAITRHPQLHRPLGVLEIRVTGKDRDLHGREFAAQRGDQGQPIHAGHADVGDQHVRFQGADKLQRPLAVAGSRHHPAVVFFPGQYFGQALYDHVLVVHDHRTVHRLPPLCTNCRAPLRRALFCSSKYTTFGGN